MIKLIIKNIVKFLPSVIRRYIVFIYELLYRVICFYKEKITYSVPENIKGIQNHVKKRILIYHIHGLGFGGTEKNLQIIANGLVEDYDVYFMHGRNELSNTRKDFLDKRINLIPFSFAKVDPIHPYFIYDMNPHIKHIINTNKIDLIIVSEVGHSIYPLLTINQTPIIMINNFGAPTVQKNIVHVNYVSETVRDKGLFWVGKQQHSVLYTPTTKPMYKDEVKNLRKELGIPEADFVFGRIGRSSNDIFDPIGIRAFQKVVKKYPNCHYIIMSPPPKLIKIINEDNIPNVHLIDSKGEEEAVWVFHNSLDCLAHFRYDGETLGLNIAESMMVGNPIISHRSKIWNAHTVYLDKSFSRVSKVDDINEYASYMEEFINIKNNFPDTWHLMRETSKRIGERLFSKDNYLASFKKIVAEKLNNLLN